MHSLFTLVNVNVSETILRKFWFLCMGTMARLLLIHPKDMGTFQLKKVSYVEL